MSPILHHAALSSEQHPPTRWLYLLHGIYGSGRNWASFARRLVEKHPDWGVILVDLRMHGESEGFTPPHTVRACAADVQKLEDALGLPAAALLGHSFGGKVALLRAAEGGPELRRIWVVDSTLQVRSPGGSAWRIIDIVRQLPKEFASRDEVVIALEKHGYEPGIGHWLAMNLRREGARFQWKLDWDAMEELLRDYFATDIWPIVEHPPAGIELHLIRAAASNAISEASIARVERAARHSGQVHLHTIAGGHWVNVENPEGLLTVISETL